jgi:tetratricopeptide (TPR) repeat protein
MMDIKDSFNNINNSNVTVHLPEHKTPTQLTSRLGKDTIIGRDYSLKKIHILLKNNSSLCINGIGGIGKSTLSSNYLHCQIKNNENLKYYGFFEGLDSFVTELRPRLNLKEKKSEDAFMEALSELSKLKGEKLLVFDDVKDIKENQDKIEKILALKDSGYKILLTSREEIKDIKKYYLDVLSLTDAKELFNSIYPVEDEVLLEEILGYLDCHAFFVEMTAKTLKSKETLMPEIIKKKFENGEFSTIKRKRKESFNDYLNELFSFDKLDNEEILMLKQLSVLPSIEIEFEFLQEIFDKKDDEEFEEILNYLCEKGWLNYSKGSCKLHQIVKEYIWIEHLPKFKEIIHIINFYNFLLRDSTDAHVSIFNQKYLLYFSSLVQLLSDKIDIKDKNLISLFFNFLGLMYRHLGNYSKALFLLEKALVLSENNLIFKSTIHNNLGTVYSSMYEKEKALKHTVLSLDIRRNIFNEDDINIADSYSNLGIQYEALGKFKKALDLLKKSVEIKEKLSYQDSPTVSSQSLGYSYHNLAGIYESLNIYDDALKFYNKTEEIFQKIYEKNHPDMATLFNNLSFLYAKMNKYQEAKNYIEKVINIREEVLPSNHSELLLAKEDLIIIEQELKKRTPVKKSVKIKRNDPCPCNSGKKYKKCCGKNS